MLRSLCAISLICGSLLSGCFSMPILLGTGWLTDSAEEAWVMSANDSVFGDPDLMPVMSTPEGTRALLLRAPRGSKVVVSINDARNHISGTLLRADDETVELMNCLSKEIVPGGPQGMMQCKTSHVPFQTLEMSSLLQLRYIAPPPPDFDAEAFTEEPGEHCVDAIVYKSGRRERFSSVPQSREPAAGTADLDEE